MKSPSELLTQNAPTQEEIEEQERRIDEALEDFNGDPIRIDEPLRVPKNLRDIIMKQYSRAGWSVKYVTPNQGDNYWEFGSEI